MTRDADESFDGPEAVSTEPISRATETLRADAPAPPADKPAEQLERIAARHGIFGATEFQRYVLRAKIGSGGSGNVFAAYDTKLRRVVAIKTLREPDPDRARMLLHEAQAQARVKHENVCQVYEVGEEDGQPFIAMQFIEGENLAQAAPKLSIAQIVDVMRQVASAIEAAHALGVMHRDIKPANVMLEQNPTGGSSLRAYVMDFGIARELEPDERLTIDDDWLGTPAYMSPEQVRGTDLDRRTDVYSFGVTLYQALTGSPPFLGRSRTVLRLVLEVEPTPVRRRAPKVPKDLETITMKCLEKDRARRYATAADVLEDLRRYAEGEPILGRPVGLLERTMKRAKKHRVLVLSCALGATGVAVGSAYGLLTRARAREEARLAAEYGREVQRIEDALRVERMLPIHDTRDAEKAIRARAGGMLEESKRSGKVGLGPGHAAAGLVHLALREYDEATGEIEAARQAGQRSPEIAGALGLSLAGRYALALEVADWIAGQDAREGAKQKARAELRDPAVLALKEAAAHPGARFEALLLEATLALTEERWDDAIAEAREAARMNPGRYEASLLESRAETGACKAAWARGRDDAAARPRCERAVIAAERGADIGRSDEEAHLAGCIAGVTLSRMDGAKGAIDEATYRRAIERCDHALTVHPGSARALLYKTFIVDERAAFEAARGHDPTPWVDEMRALGQQALEAHTNDVEALVRIGQAELTLADYQALHGIDPTPAVTRGLDALAKAPPGTSFAKYHQMTGAIHMTKAQWLRDHGNDPLADLAASQAAFEAMAALDQRDIAADASIASCHEIRAQWLRHLGQDPRAEIAIAIAMYQRVLDKAPGDGLIRGNLGVAYSEAADYEISAGLDPTSSLDKTIATYEAAIAQNGTIAFVYENLAEGHLSRASWLLSRDRDPTDAIAKARDALARCRKVDPTNLETWAVEARALVLLARWAARDKDDREVQALFDSAAEALKKPLDEDEDEEVKAVAALVEIRRAAWLVSKRRPAKTALDRGHELARKLEGNAAGAAIEGALTVVTARAAADPATRAKLLTAAREAFDRAKASDPSSLAQVEDLAAEAR